MTETVRSQMRDSEMRFLRKIIRVTMLDKVSNSAIRDISISSRYFSGSNDFNLDGLIKYAESHRNGFSSKLYVLT